MSAFNELNLRDELIAAIKRMKYETPTPVQEQAIPILLQGNDLIASSQTGTGKTLAFGLPLVQRLLEDKHCQALVLAPTRELAVQIHSVLVELTVSLRINSALLIGGLSMYHQRVALRRQPRIIVATPGRLVDHLSENYDLLTAVSFLVLDEGDRMLDLGFARQLETIRKATSTKRQTLLFSATFPSDIKELAAIWLKDPKQVLVGSVTQPVSEITQAVVRVSDVEKRDTLLSEVKKREGSVLIFTRTKRRTDTLATFLERQAVSVCRIHGNRSQSQRQAAIDGFRSGRFRVMVATDIAARGIDIPRIEHVINYDMPMAAEDYLHRIGRTGRAGRSGESLCLVTPHDHHYWWNVEKLLRSRSGLSSNEQRSQRAGSAGQRSNGPRRSVQRRSGRYGRSSSRQFAYR